MLLTVATVAPDRASKITAISWIGAAFFGVLALRYAWSLLKPGTLTISPAGITQDLGWRRKHWNWADIDQVELRRTAANFVSVCMLFPIAKPPVRLFGWNLSAAELYETIQRDRTHYSNSTMI